MVDLIHRLGIIQDCHIQIKAAPPLRGFWVKDWNEMADEERKRSGKSLRGLCTYS